MSGMRDALDAQHLPSPDHARQVRVDAGLSANAFAQALGVATSTLLRWEKGLTIPRLASRAAWARALRALTTNGPVTAADAERIVAPVTRPRGDWLEGWIKCPTCEALVGERCRSAAGKPVAWHTSRRALGTRAVSTLRLIATADRVVTEQGQEARNRNEQPAPEPESRDLATLGGPVSRISTDAKESARLGDGDGGSVADVSQVHEKSMTRGPIASESLTQFERSVIAMRDALDSVFMQPVPFLWEGDQA